MAKLTVFPRVTAVRQHPLSSYQSPCVIPQLHCTHQRSKGTGSSGATAFPAPKGASKKLVLRLPSIWFSHNLKGGMRVLAEGKVTTYRALQGFNGFQCPVEDVLLHHDEVEGQGQAVV